MLNWFKRFRKEPEDSGIGLLMAEMKREADLREQGWLPFYPHIEGAPWPSGLIDIMQRDGTIWTTEYDRVPREWNVAGKFWRQSRFTEGLTIEGTATPGHSLISS